MKTEKKYMFIGTLFSNCMGQTGTEESIFSWMADIKNGKYKIPVEKIRKVWKEGKTAEVARLKRSLPAIAPAGVLREGRTEADPILLSRVGMADYDNHNHEWAVAARDSLKGVPGVLGAYVSIRDGLHVMYLLPDLVREDFTFYSNVVLEFLDKKVGYPHDKQVTKVTHLISASYDPDAWFITPKEATEFPVEKVLEDIQHKVQLSEWDEAEAAGSLPQDMEPSLDAQVDSAYQTLLNRGRKTYSKVQLDDHFTRFQGRCPIIQGQRNTNLIRLGQFCHFMRYNQEELEYIIHLAYRLIGDKEYTEKRIRQCVCWGFTHNENQIAPEKYAKQLGLDYSDLNSDSMGRLGHLGHLGHYRGVSREDDDQHVSFQEAFNNEVNANCPYIPDVVYDMIPEFFKPLLSHSANRRDKDISFIYALGALSAATPNVTVQVRQKRYSTNVYTLCIAPAGAGKGVATLAPRLLSTIQKRIEAANNRQREEYEEKKLRWSLEFKKALCERREADRSLRPGDCPTPKTLVAEPQTSRSKLIADLAENPHGLFMFTSELNVINESLHSDCGQHSAELAGINMNERQGYSYKHDEHKVVSEFPKLTILATGTPSQYVSFIGNTHAGMESRAYTMLAASYPEWISWADEDESDIDRIDKAYQEAADKVADMYEFLLKFPTHVVLSVEQRAVCDKHCKLYFERLISEKHGELDSLVKRLPIQIARICGILCAMRKVEMGFTGVKMQATDEDVEIALKIAVMMLRHTCLATTMLVEDPTQINKPKNVFKREEAFNKLPERFTIPELTKVCVSDLHSSASTIKRTIQNWLDTEYVRRVQRGVYMKTGKAIL